MTTFSRHFVSSRGAMCRISYCLAVCVVVGIPAFAFSQKKEQTGETVQSPPSKQFSSNQDQVKTDLLGDPLPQQAKLRLGTNRFCPPSSLELMLSADEKIVVAFGKKVTAWESGTGKLLWAKDTRIPRGSGGSASYGYRRICGMPKSGQFVTAAQPGAIDLWDFETGGATTIETGTKEKFKSIDVSPDESMFALGGENRLLVCDRSGKEIFRKENFGKAPVEKKQGMRSDRLMFGGEYNYGRFSPDGRLLVLVNSRNPKTIAVLDSKTGEVTRRIETKGKVVRFDFSVDSRQIATTERDIAARAYDLETGETVWENRFSVPGLDERYTSDLQYSPSGDLLAVATAIGEDQRIQLLDSRTGEKVGALAGHTWKPWSLQFTQDGTQLFSCGWDKVIRRWDIESRQQIRVENTERASSVCAMAPDGKTIGFCDDSGHLHIVDSVTGKKIKTLKFPGAGNAQISFSQDGKLLAGGGAVGNELHVFVWELENYELKHHWQWPKGRDAHSSFEAMSFSRDGQRLGVAVFRQSSCYVFDLPSDKRIVEALHPQVYGMSLSPDGQQFVSAGWDKMIRLWDTESGEVLKETAVSDANNPRADTRMYGASFSHDGSTIATLGMDPNVRFWSRDLEMKSVTNFQKRRTRVHHGSFELFYNGLWVAVGFSNGSVAVFDIRSGNEVWSCKEHQNGIYNVDIGADDSTLLTGGSDGVCYLWDLNDESSDEGRDLKERVEDLLGPDPQTAFASHQYLAANAKKAIPAIRRSLEEHLENWDELDGEEAKEAVHRVNRVAMLIAEMDNPDASGLLVHLFKISPNAAVKKAFFLARRHHKTFLVRIGKMTGDND